MLSLFFIACTSQKGSDGAAEGATTPSAITVKQLEGMKLTDPKAGVAGSPGNLIPSKTNPNGMSELAVLMREMQTHAAELRSKIDKGEALGPFPKDQMRIFSSWATDMSVRNEGYEEFSRGYLIELKMLHEVPAGERKERFGRLLDSCVGCHQQSCPGPIVAIEALRF